MKISSTDQISSSVLKDQFSTISRDVVTKIFTVHGLTLRDLASLEQSCSFFRNTGNCSTWNVTEAALQLVFEEHRMYPEFQGEWTKLVLRGVHSWQKILFYIRALEKSRRTGQGDALCVAAGGQWSATVSSSGACKLAGPLETKHVPRKVKDLQSGLYEWVTFLSVAVSMTHAVLCTDIGVPLLYCEGDDFEYQDVEHDHLRQLAGIRGIRVSQVAAGNAYGVLLTDDGKVFTFGSNANGCLGRPETSSNYEAALVDGLDDVFVEHVAAGELHVLACGRNFGDGSGRVFSWGEDVAGSLGLGRRRSYSLCEKPTSVWALESSMPRMLMVAAGRHHSLALSALGEVFFWGSRTASDESHSMAEDVLEPRLIEGASKLLAVYVAAAGDHSVLVSGHGNVYAWGSLPWALCCKMQGHPDFHFYNGFRNAFPVPGINRIRILGSDHEANNAMQQCSNAAAADQRQSPGSAICQVAAATEHHLLRTTDGKVYQSGLNDRGQVCFKGNQPAVDTGEWLAFVQDLDAFDVMYDM